EWDEKGWKLWEQLTPHCQTVLDRLRNHALEPKATGIMTRFALWLNNRAEFGEAEPLYLRALAIREKALGSEHPDVASSLICLAALYDNQGQYAKSEPLCLRALAIWEKALGSEHPNVASGLNSLALLY